MSLTWSQSVPETVHETPKAFELSFGPNDTVLLTALRIDLLVMIFATRT